MHGDNQPLTTDKDWERACKEVIRSLTYKWRNAHYRLDVESIVWYAAGLLWTHPEEERTISLLRFIADTILYREVNVKVRNVCVIDTSNFNQETEPSAYDECQALSKTSLTEDELQFLSWILDDGMRLADIAKMRGVSRSTVTKKWQKIIAKLKEENL